MIEVQVGDAERIEDALKKFRRKVQRAGLLKELRRILKPGGICVLTTHGEYAFLRHYDSLKEYGNLTRLDQIVIRQLELFGISDTLVNNHLGSQLESRNYYRNTFQLRQQVEQQWSQFFKIIAYYPAALQVSQDIVVMRRE
jgi:SAM-dependent methyltransferase